MASATHHQRSSSASINPATLLESCRVYPPNGGGAGILGSRTGTSSSSHNITSTAMAASSGTAVAATLTTGHSNNNKSTAATVGTVQPADNHSSEWDAELPVCFCEKRHVQPIEGIKCITQSWRMKERVRWPHINGRARAATHRIPLSSVHR